MKYCNNCGNKLKDEQVFCEKCGTNISNDINMNNSKEVKSQGLNIGKIFIVLISTVIILLLISVLSYGVYKVYTIYNSSDSSKLTNSNERAQQTNSQRNGPTINVLSDNFSSNFMNEDKRNGYGEINIGMNKSEVESKFGGSENSLIIAGVNTEKYGNIAVHYVNDIVDRYFITPDNININEYENFHGNSTMKASEGGVIYDDNAYNSFTIKVFTDENGQIIGIENVDQIERSVSNNKASHDVISESQAKSMAIDYLDEVYEDYWYHSINEYNGVYRVNYGEGNASHAHDAIYIDQKTGNITETDPNNID